MVFIIPVSKYRNMHEITDDAPESGRTTLLIASYQRSQVMQRNHKHRPGLRKIKESFDNC
jgi:hypothetical protein